MNTQEVNNKQRLLGLATIELIGLSIVTDQSVLQVDRTVFI